MVAFSRWGKLKALEQHWRAACSGKNLPARQNFDPVALRDWLGNLILAEVVDDGADFVFRLYGTHVAHANGSDMTGRSVRDLPERRVDIVASAYRETVAARGPHLSAHIMQAGPGKYTAWERIALPLASDGTRIDMLLVGLYRITVPDIDAYRAFLAREATVPVTTIEPGADLF